MEGKQIALWQDWNQSLPKFDFSSVDATTLNASDIVGRLIIGKIPKVDFRRNFQRCAFRQSTGSGLEWGSVDYKDSIFVDATFEDSTIGGGSTVSCTYTNCRFERCSFEEAAIHDTIYVDCVFIECDFRRSMIRNSQVTSCHFIRCVTSNKLFDGCQVNLNVFDNTYLDFRAIIDNFGLDINQIDLTLIREDRTYPTMRIFDFAAKSQDLVWVDGLSQFDKMKIQYYLDGGEVIGNDVIDAIFLAKEWLGAVRAPVNLLRLLQDFSDFLLRLYEGDKISSVFIVKLAQLSHSLWNEFSNNLSYSQIGNAAAGIYVNCLRWLEKLDSVIENALYNNQEKICLRSYDDASDEEVTNLVSKLRSIIPGGDIVITPRNSPVDVIVSHTTPETIGFIVTLFFCTKTKLELSRVGNNDKVKSTSPLLNIALGGAKDQLHTAFLVSTKLPGALNISLEVNYSSALVSALRKVIKDII